MSVTVVPYLFKPFYKNGGVELHYLRRQADSQSLYSETDIAKEVEQATSLTCSDFVHALNIFTDEIKKVLVRGNRVKISGLGTFYMTISSTSKELKEELSIRDIKRVNIRFLPDKALKLVNNALATTRSDNNVSFVIKNSASGNSGNGIYDNDYIDPNA